MSDIPAIIFFDCRDPRWNGKEYCFITCSVYLADFYQWILILIVFEEACPAQKASELD